MATTKIWKVQKRLDHVINYATNEKKTKNNNSKYGMDEFNSIKQVMTYATNPDKTEKQFYTTGINCKVDNAVKEMQFVKKLYGKEKGTVGVRQKDQSDSVSAAPFRVPGPEHESAGRKRPSGIHCRIQDQSEILRVQLKNPQGKGCGNLSQNADCNPCGLVV